MNKHSSISRFLAPSLAAIFFISCKSGPEEAVSKISIQVSDSISIEYLGNLKLEGYDRKSDQYLLSNDGMIPILEVNSEGEVTRNHSISHEGPNAIPHPGSLGYLNGDLLV